MSHTDKDSRESRRDHWQSVLIPSWWNREQRKRQRNKARRDMQNRREPQPDYGDQWFW